MPQDQQTQQPPQKESRDRLKEPVLRVELPPTIEKYINQLNKGEKKYQDLPEEIRNNREIIEVATFLDANNIKHVPDKLIFITDEKFTRDLVRANGYVLTIGLKEGVLPEYLKNDKQLWLDAITNSPELVKSIPTEIYKNLNETISIISEAIIRNPETYKFLANEYKEIPEVSLCLLNTNQGSKYFSQVPDKLRQDITFIEKAIAINGELFKFLNDKSNPKFILSAVASDSSIIQLVPDQILKNSDFQVKLIETSINAKKELQKKGIELSEAAKNAHEKMSLAYGVLSIDLRMHDSNNNTVDVKYFDNSKEVIRNRYSVAEDKIKTKLESLLGKEYFADLDLKKPVALVLYPRYDGKVFNQDNLNQRDCIDRLCNSHRVIFYQAGSKNDIVDSFIESTENKKTLVSLLLLGGHGDPYSVLLGEKSKLTIFDSELSSRVKDFMADPSTVILNSCSTGDKNPLYGKLNIATFLSGIWPQATVIAPTKDTYQAQVNSLPNGEFVSAFYENNEGLIRRLQIDARGPSELIFANEQQDKNALLKIYVALSKKGGYVYGAGSRHGKTCNYLGIESQRNIEAINFTPWERQLLADLLTTKIIKDLVDSGGLLTLNQKGNKLDEKESKALEATILASLNVKERNNVLLEIKPNEHQIVIKLKDGFDITFSCEFNYEKLKLISSNIHNAKKLSEIDN